MPAKETPAGSNGKPTATHINNDGELQRANGLSTLPATTSTTPNTIGNEGVFEDVGFHAIGNQFHGPINRLNVFPGSGRSIAVSDGEVMKNLNLSRYKVDFENPVANLIHKTGQPVPIRVEIIYNKSNMASRPDAFKEKLPTG